MEFDSLLKPLITHVINRGIEECGMLWTNIIDIIPHKSITVAKQSGKLKRVTYSFVPLVFWQNVTPACETQPRC